MCKTIRDCFPHRVCVTGVNRCCGLTFGVSGCSVCSLIQGVFLHLAWWLLGRVPGPHITAIRPQWYLVFTLISNQLTLHDDRLHGPKTCMTSAPAWSINLALTRIWSEDRGQSVVSTEFHSMSGVQAKTASIHWVQIQKPCSQIIRQWYKITRQD